MKRYNIERNKDIALLVLSGKTLDFACGKYGLTRERARQITAKYCRLKNSEFYSTMPKSKTCIKWLRENKHMFIDA